MFRSYFKVAMRNLKRNKIYSFINIAGLSLGLACAMLILLYTKDEVSYDKFHANVNQIYRIVSKRTNPDGTDAGMGGNTGILQGPRFTKALPEMQSFVRLQSGYEDIRMGTEVKGQELLYVDSNFFSVFSFPVLSGNPKTALADPKSVVVSEEMAKRYFGTSDAVGKAMYFKNNDRFDAYTVTAVAKKCPQNSSIKFDVLRPIMVADSDQQNSENWFNFFLNTFVVVHPGTSQTSLEAKMKSFYQSDAGETIKMMAEKYGDKTTTTYLLQPFVDMHLSKQYVADNGLSDASNPMFSYILSGIALFILVIACINFINLTVARSLKRAKEIGIRKVVGSDRKQLITQFLGESFILCFGAFVLAIIIVQLTLPAFNHLSNKALSLSYLLDTKLVLLYMALFIVTGLLAGFYPALVLSGYNPVDTLYSRFMLHGKNYLQKSLVVLQFSLATLLIIATITIYSQFNYLTTKKLGYDDTNLVKVSKQNLTRAEVKLLRESLTHNPNIVGMAPKNGGFWGTIAKINGENQVEFAYETVDEAYLPLYKIPIIKGRNFSPEFGTDSTGAVLVNETFVQKAGWKEPIGQEINFWYSNNKYKVIGVVKDHHYASLNEKIGPQVFTMKPSNPFGVTFIKIKPNTAAASLKFIEATFKKLFPLSPYSYSFKDADNIRQYESEAKWKQVILFGAILTIFISCIGLFGLSVLSAEKRLKEIGIRKVLGASVQAVVTTLSKDFIKLIIIALIIAMPAAWYATSKWLENYPYRVQLNPWMFIIAGLLVIMVALVTVSYQAIRAAMSNPVKSLRTE